MMFCPKCGEAIEDSCIVCPKCQAQIKIEKKYEKLEVVYYDSTKAIRFFEKVKYNKRIGEIQEKLTPIVNKYRKPILVGMIALAIICFSVAIRTVTSEKYSRYTQSYSEYIANYKENSSIAKSYGGVGILGMGYQRVAEGWKDLADDIGSKIWGLRIRAIILIIIAAISTFFSYKIYNSNKISSVETKE